MSKKKIFFYSIFSIFFIFFLFEFASRSIVSVLAKNSDIFKYGFNKNIDLQIRKLSTLDFEVINNEVFDVKKIDTVENNSEKELIWAFGGSTSDIACRKENKTSWPKELENKTFTVKNYGKSGTNSDFALNSLISNINNGDRSDIILWANYVNETDVISLGFKRNPELSAKIKSNVNINRSLYFLKSLSKSIKNYSIFFFLLDDISLRVMYRLNLTEIFFAKDRELTINDYEVSAQNYYLNTIKAIELANKIDARFYIVTLFAKADLKNKDEESIENLSVKRKVFFKVIQKILDQNEKANWINLKEYQANEDLSIDKMFCDNIHFTTKGNQTVANILYKYLN